MLNFGITDHIFVVAWDQSTRFLKLYVTLPNVQNAPAENIHCNFTEWAIALNVKGLENKNYHFTIKNLLHAINPNKSSWKIKTGIFVFVVI